MNKFFPYIILCVFALSLTTSGHIFAQTAEELQSKINEHNATIQQLNAEINQYQTELTKTSSQAQTLQTAVKSLDINSKKLGTDVKVTTQKIDTTNLEIKKIGSDINVKQSAINRNKTALAEALRSLNETDDTSFIETLLTYDNISTFWDHVTTLEQYQIKLESNVHDLQSTKQSLEQNKQKTEVKKQSLESLKSQLSDQQKAVDVLKTTKAQLLDQTKNKESNYQKLLAEKMARKAAFEKELNDYESKLRLVIDPNSIPAVKSGILAWPTVRHTITQLFGDTEFARSHTQAYNGKGHGGIDIAASIGSPIMSALDGTVKASGDTDKACPGASFGRWVLIEHPNGLTTLYAHLSLIKVSQGQVVKTGETIGLAGATGYATGPHLHFSVYASEGVRVISRPSASCGGKIYTLPVADLKAYLNPMLYL